MQPKHPSDLLENVPEEMIRGQAVMDMGRELLDRAKEVSRKIEDRVRGLCPQQNNHQEF